MRGRLPEGHLDREHRDDESRLHRCSQEADRLKLVALVALGGAAGAVARYGISSWIFHLTGPGFPWATLVVNISGSFALGLSIGLLHVSAVAPETRAFLMVGLLGGFTTFSTFSYEAVLLLQEAEWARAAAYVTGSVAVGLLAVVAGFWIAGSP